MASEVLNLYVVGADEDGPIKIGLARDVASRLALLQTGNPFRLRALAVVEVPSEIAHRAERACHLLLKDKRVVGEWFLVSSGIAAAILDQVVRTRAWEEESDELDDRIQVRLPLDMKAEVERAAREDDRDVSYWVRRAIKEALEKRRKS